MLDDSLLNRIKSIKTELEQDIDDSIRIFHELKKILIGSENVNESDVCDILKEYYTTYPDDYISNDIVDLLSHINNYNFGDAHFFAPVPNNINNLNQNLFPINLHMNIDVDNVSNVNDISSLLELSNMMSLSINTSFENTFINDYETFEEQEHVDIPLILKESEFNNLEKLKFKNLNDEEKNYTKCAISLNEFDDNSDIVKLPCSHIFMIDECKEWLLNNSHKCPICRCSAGEYYAKLN